MLEVDPKGALLKRLSSVLANRIVECLVGGKVGPQIFQNAPDRQRCSRAEPYQTQTGAAVVTRSGQHSRKPPLSGRLERGDRQRARGILRPGELGSRGLGTPLSLAADTPGVP